MTFAHIRYVSKNQNNLKLLFDVTNESLKI